MKKQSLNLYRIALVVSLLLIVAGIVGYFLFGFQLGVDFSGGTQIVLDLGAAYEMSDVRSAFDAEGVQGARYLTASDGGIDDTAIIRIAGEDDYSQIAANVQSALASKYPKAQITACDAFEADAKALTIANAALVFAVAVVVIFVYAWLRYKLAAALTMLIGQILAMGAGLGLMILVQISVNAALVSALLGAAGYTAVVLMVVCGKLVQNNRKYNPRQVSRKDVAAKTQAELCPVAGTIAGGWLALCILLCVLVSFVVIDFALPLLAASVLGTVVALLVAPMLWGCLQDSMNHKKLGEKAVIAYTGCIEDSLASSENASQKKSAKSQKGKKR